MLTNRSLSVIALVAFGCSSSGERDHFGTGGASFAGSQPSGGASNTAGSGSSGEAQGGKAVAGDAGATAGSGGLANAEGGDENALIVPKDLIVSALPGGNGAFELLALSLAKGETNTELYAALRNTGTLPACDAAVTIELFDKAEQSVAAGIAGLHTKRTYQPSDGSTSYASCVGAGDVTMAAIKDLPPEIAIEDIGYAVYKCNYFGLDLTPVTGLSISDISSVTNATGTAYTGTLVNGLDVVVTKPSVTVFATNRVGRPLGIASTTGTDNVAPGGSWSFQTSTLKAAPADYVAFPAAALAK